MMMRNVEKADLIPGVVLRMVFHDGSADPFSDCVIESVSEDEDEVALVRPYAQFVLQGGSSYIFISEERFNAPISRLSMFRTVLNDRGDLYMVVIHDCDL